MEVDRIICGDCLDVMKDMPDNSVDLVITSPPYNTGGKSLGYHPNSKTGDNFYDQHKDNMANDEYGVFLFERIAESLNVARYSFWDIQILSGNKAIMVKTMEAFAKFLKDVFVWQKQAVSQITRGRTAKGFELVLMFGKDDNMTFEYNNFPPNGYVPNIRTWYKTESIPEHHATFPLPLPLYFIQHFSKEGDLILDPFCGSGTTCVAAKMLGRHYIGIDISEKYCQIARKRIEAAEKGITVKELEKGQKTLF